MPPSYGEVEIATRVLAPRAPTVAFIFEAAQCATHPSVAYWVYFAINCLTCSANCELGSCSTIRRHVAIASSVLGG